MARHKANQNKVYVGKLMVMAGLTVLLAEFWFVARPVWEMAGRFKEGILGVVPGLGVCILNATHALAFQQIDYISLISRILVLSCAVASVIAGIALLRPRLKQPLVIELALSQEFEGRETINNGSR